MTALKCLNSKARILIISLFIMKPKKKKQHEADPEENNEASFNLHLPGLQKSVNVPYPRNLLPSCDKCKRQYKSRYICRQERKHKTLPWCSVFICITIDESCIDIDRNCLIDNSLDYTISDPSEEWRRYTFKDYDKKHEIDVSMKLYGDERNRKNQEEEEDQDKEREIDISMRLYSDERNTRNREEEVEETKPMCYLCKTKNFKTAYCRERRPDLRHYYLPWTTIYVDMSLSKTNKEDKDKEPATRNTTSKNHRAEKNDFIQTNDRYQENVNAETFFDNIDSSRTFLVQISSKSYKIQWVDFDSDAKKRKAQKSKYKRKQPYWLSSREMDSSKKRKDESSIPHYPYHHDSMPNYNPAQAVMQPLPLTLPLPPSQSVNLSCSLLSDSPPALRGLHHSYHNPHHSYNSVFSPGMHTVPTYCSNVSQTNYTPNNEFSKDNTIDDTVLMSMLDEINSNVYQDNVSSRQEGVYNPLIHQNENIENTNSSNSATTKYESLEAFVSEYFTPPPSP